MSTTTHEHRESRVCSCWPLALEPSERCPVHGTPWPPRCAECGHFFARAPLSATEEGR